MLSVMRFLRDSVLTAFRGSRRYLAMVAVLLAVVAVGVRAYLVQLRQGMIVTGLTDQVSWGTYIANFAFLIALAVGAVMLVIPAYIFHQAHAKRVVLIAQGVAVAACVSALMFVLVDLGRPDRIFFMMPVLGSLNLPRSLLAWDTITIPGYILLNLCIPVYVLFRRYTGHEVTERRLFPWIILTIAWAFAAQAVEAFIFTADVARPMWHTPVLAPRFLASAACSGPAFLIVALWGLRRWGGLQFPDALFNLLALIVAAALQLNLIMFGAELFSELYRPNEHNASAIYLFLGLGEHDALVPWIWSAIAMEFTAAIILMIRPLRQRTPLLLAASVVTVVGVWIEKAMGLVVPGFIPSPLGEVVEYAPSAIEMQVSAGIWALGLLIFVVLAKVAIAIDRGDLRAAT